MNKVVSTILCLINAYFCAFAGPTYASQQMKYLACVYEYSIDWDNDPLGGAFTAYLGGDAIEKIWVSPSKTSSVSLSHFLILVREFPFDGSGTSWKVHKQSEFEMKILPSDGFQLRSDLTGKKYTCNINHDNVPCPAVSRDN